MVVIILVLYFIIICGEVWSTQTKKSAHQECVRQQCDCEKHTGFPSHPLL